MSFTLPIGFRMGGMTLGACLGQGGFGITYLAQLDDTDMTLAVKEYFPSDFATRDANLNVVPDHQNRDLFDMGMQAFLSEANILRTLPRQPGLVRVRGAFERLGTAYCVMEYIEGDPMDRMLPRVIRARGHVPEPLIEQFVSSISAALGVVHAKGLIHRDVKPANVMIRRDGQPVLIDFGAARPYGRRQNDPAMYTRKYAPLELFPLEQLPKRMLLREGPWSDIFSLSVMLYEMLTQRVPPDAKIRLQMLIGNGADPYVPVAQMLAQTGATTRYSPRLIEMVDQGCALMAEDRPADAYSFCRIFTEPANPSANSAPGAAKETARSRLTGIWKPRNTGQGGDARPMTLMGGDAPQTELSPEKLAARDRRRGVFKMLGLILLLAIGAVLFGYLGQP